MLMKKYLIFLVILIVLIAGGVLIFVQHKNPTNVSKQTAVAEFSCDRGKTISADFYQGAAKPASVPGGPPTPGGSVVLTLSDGRAMTLPQTISADGARYANADESVVFWNVDSSAMLVENGQQTFSGCIAVASDPGGLPQTYASSTAGFSIRFPAGFTADENYSYQEMGPGTDIAGVKFTIPASVAAGTNLGSDSYLSVEQIPQTATNTQNCSANLFLDLQGAATNLNPTTVTDDGTTYSLASTTGAGAGNRYEETVYAIPGTNPCIAVRYFVHYGVIENYPAGTVKQFDSNSLYAQFDAIRRTLTIAR
jgi:membrane-bound inhibitor of C-type lysozyme